MKISQISWIIFLVTNLAVIVTALKIYFEEIEGNICYKITGTVIIAILTAIMYKSSWDAILKLSNTTALENKALLLMTALSLVLICDVATLIFTGHVKIEIKRKS